MPPCPSCAAQNRPDARFCASCGSPLERLCPNGHPVAATARFCDSCGVPLEGGAAPADAPAAPTSERRLVSILFADLVGFTTLSESRDPEEVRELLSRYFDTCRRLIELYGGTVEKFIGDAVMAVWGTPTATEDDAERAVRAALDLVAAVSALGDELGAPGLRARTGVLTGEAAVNLGAVGQGMVAGDLVNTASRVQSAAEPGTVLVGEATRRSSEQAIAYVDAGEHELRGKDGRTRLWRALRVVSGVGGELRSPGLEAPFVGRDRELRRIKELFHECAGERKPHLVSVTGIAGIGKSRLAWEFYKYFDGIVEQVWWHRGRCLAYGEGVTYWALADMVRSRCRIAEDEPSEAAWTKLRATLAEHLLDEGERRFVEPRLAQLLGLGATEAPDREELFAAWRVFFERLADSNPVLLVFEDLQWADTSLLDFVEYLLEWSRSHPILVVTLARPELLEKRPTWGAGQRSFSALHLEPLPPETMEELLAGLVPGLPAPVRAQILERAEGVPLYAVETVRMLLDRGLLVEDGASYRVAGEVGALEVPETLQALIAARLDGLGEQERRLLQDGAVLGKTFTRAAIAALAGRPQAELEPLLTGLVRKEVLSLQSDPRSPEHGQYGFLQDLVRRVAYDTLARRERRSRHVAAAEHLASALGEDEAAEVVAAHLLAAFDAVPDAADAGELEARAVEALERAGERAASLAAAAEARRYFEQAAERSRDAHARPDLVARAGEMALRSGDPAAARALLEQALADSEAQGAAAAAAHVSSLLADLDLLEGHPQRGVARLEPALATLDAGEPDGDVALLSEKLGRLLFFSREDARALPHLERALDLAEALELPEVLSQALNTKGLLAFRRGRPYEARVLLEAALATALEHDRHGAALRAYNNLGFALESSEAYEEAATVMQRALELARRIGHRVSEANFIGGSISLLGLVGRWDEAVAAVDAIVELGLVEYMQTELLPIVPLWCEQGELEEARRRLDSCSVAASVEEVQALTSHAFAEARLLRAEGRAREALAAAERALVHREELGPTSSLAKLSLVEGLEAALAAGEPGRARELLATLETARPGELTPFLRAQRARFRARLGAGEADAELRAAAELLRGQAMPFHLAAVRLEHAERLAAEGRLDEAAPPLEEARQIFERLRARPWLERVDAVREGRRAEVPA